MASASIFCANAPEVDPGAPAVATGAKSLATRSTQNARDSCIGDRSSLHLQQICSKISPLG
jgi:hypothetical protein